MKIYFYYDAKKLNESAIVQREIIAIAQAVYGKIEMQKKGSKSA